ncbi:beta-ketoacyl synthase N-terminal-like domain-containing protein [Kribbella sp. NPDC050124]|uniref:beta-ketoacyl synthase N-terminal-like domain-containing protein n=1 Tax=Kribbella sp. NPDC050124 TaxID=3364114 RepID=UPI0037977521
MSMFAIVGLSCLFPGAHSPEEFWTNLRDGVDSRRDGGPELFGSADTDPEHQITCTRGGFVTDFAFEPSGYLLAPGLLGALDPVFQWSLHVAREALRDSGHAERPDVLGRCGLVLGNYSFPTPSSARISVPLVQEAVLSGLRGAGLPIPPRSAMYELEGTAGYDARVSGAPARVAAEALGLGGPRYALDAACSSALYALKLACDHLATGQADLMLAGGVCAPDPALIHLCFSDLHAYSDNGISQPFDARSTGIITGRGAGMMAVRRLSDALADGDEIYAVIDGIGLSNDGLGRHLLVPNAAGQLAAYEHAYAQATIAPGEIDYLECHATGTPIGDRTEAESVLEWFGPNGPLLGSVKANLGHLLTVAGLSSLLKVILAMRHGELPPTIGIESPGAAGVDAQLVRARRDWPATQGPRRAAVSAFGFGGTNAHVLLSQPKPAPSATPPAPVEPPALDVIGLGAHFGPFESVAAFERAMHDGTDGFRPLPDRRWRGLDRTADGMLERAGLGRETLPAGAFVDTVALDPVDHRIPPADLRNYNLQHALLSKVADEALRDAGFSRVVPAGESGPSPRRCAVVVAMEIEPSAHLHLARYGIGSFLRQLYDEAGLELTDDQREALAAIARDAVHEPIVANEVLSYIGSIMASRISSLWNLTGPSFTVSADEAVAAEALQIAQLLLVDESIEAVLVGAVDLAGSPENLLLRGRHGDGTCTPGLTFGDGQQGWRIGEGAGAVVVTRPGTASRKPYATVESVVVRHAAPTDGRPAGTDPGLLAAAATEALAGAGISAADVGYVEAHADGTPDADRAELAALAEVYPASAGAVAFGSAKAHIGDTGVAAGMAGLLRAVLCLHHRYLPGAPGWRRPGDGLAEDFAASAFYVPETSRPWFRATNGSRRYAAVSLLGSYGAHGQLVLSAGDTADTLPASNWKAAGGPLLLALGAPDLPGLVAELTRHQELLSADTDPSELARAAAGRLNGGTLRAVIVGHDTAELRHQLELAARDLPGAFERGDEWATPAGSFFTGRPIGPDGKVALVYPGAFNTYPGLGQDLFRAFPGLLTTFESETETPDRTFRAAELYPRTQVTPDRRALMELESRFGDELPFLLVTGTTFAILATDLLREVLRVPVHGAFGYSLGESSMLFATGGWQREGRRDDRITATPLFRDRLCGPRRTVRESWQLAGDVPDEQVWASFVLLDDAERVQAALATHDRVYLTHVNTPTEVVIAGDPAQCRSLIADLGCPSARSPVNAVMHCPVVDGELAGLAKLNDHPTGTTGGLELLSAYDYEPMPDLERGAIAERIAQTLRSTIDFARLVSTAYDRGFRHFVEVGPGATCTRWVHETLAGQPHTAVAVDRRGASVTRSVASLVARLVANGVPVDLSALLGPAASKAPAARERLLVPVGGGASIPDRIARDAAPLAAEILAAGNRPAAQNQPENHLPTQSAEPASWEVMMPADLSLTDAETLTFDGEPMTFLPWTAPDAPTPNAPAPVGAPGIGAGFAKAASPTASPIVGRADRTAAAELAAEMRQQVLATHSVVMETHRVLQDYTLTRTEALLDNPPAARPAPATPAVPITPAAPVIPVTPAAPAPALPVARGKQPGVIWEEQDLLAFATGRIADVFGPEFAEIDGYAKRVRLPAPPYHFVSRVLELKAETGVYEPAFIRTEYDVPSDAWYAVGGGVPPAVAIEAGQCDLLLISYLGIDFRNKGERVYRLLDSTLVFHGDLPSVGQTLRYDISINRFVRQGETTLFFFSYFCYADGELILELQDACAGFFTQAELDTPLGVVLTEQEQAQRAALTKTWFKPLATTAKDHLTAADLELLAQGRPEAVFGPEHAQDPGLNPALRLPDARLRMVDEIRIDRTGGPRGLGAITAYKRLEPDGWYFECHFPDDPVLAGSMVAEGAVQTLQAYLLHQGMHLVLPDARFQTIIGLSTQVQVRGQITPEHREIRYEIEVMELTLLPRPSVIADILVYLGDKPVIRMRDFGIQIREKAGTPYRPERSGIPAFLGRRNRSGEPAMINELHLAHAAKGNLGTAMGPEFDIYGERRAPYIPNGDFQFVDRIMSLTGTRGELRPGAEMVTEYDSPADAWYYRENSHPHMPNCVYMETSLQAAILLGYYLGATLDQPETEYSIRNLDGRATLVKDIDLRGKTIRHHSKLLMSSAVTGAVLQNFSYELSADGEVFYTGESMFGYFSEAALSNQVGLDNGSYVPPWIEGERPDPSRVRRIELPDDAPAFTDPSGGRLRLPAGHFHLVDRVDLVADGGRHGAGYVHGFRAIRPDEWYFDCHFHRDPVMPGSLGVEAVLQAMRLFVLDQGLAEGIERPRFAMATAVETSWKYRGQILRPDEEARFDVHVKRVERDQDRLIVVADADLWKPGLRIYELTDLAIEVRPDTEPRPSAAGEQA